jgi:hypothetical protein
MYLFYIQYILKSTTILYKKYLVSQNVQWIDLRFGNLCYKLNELKICVVD